MCMCARGKRQAVRHTRPASSSKTLFSMALLISSKAQSLTWFPLSLTLYPLLLTENEKARDEGREEYEASACSLCLVSVYYEDWMSAVYDNAMLPNTPSRVILRMQRTRRTVSCGGRDKERTRNGGRAEASAGFAPWPQCARRWISAQARVTRDWVVAPSAKFEFANWVEGDETFRCRDVLMNDWVEWTFLEQWVGALLAPEFIVE